MSLLDDLHESARTHPGARGVLQDYWTDRGRWDIARLWHGPLEQPTGRLKRPGKLTQEQQERGAALAAQVMALGRSTAPADRGLFTAGIHGLWLYCFLRPQTWGWDGRSQYDVIPSSIPSIMWFANPRAMVQYIVDHDVPSLLWRPNRNLPRVMLDALPTVNYRSVWLHKFFVNGIPHRDWLAALDNRTMSAIRAEAGFGYVNAHDANDARRAGIVNNLYAYMIPGRFVVPRYAMLLIPPDVLDVQLPSPGAEYCARAALAVASSCAYWYPTQQVIYACEPMEHLSETAIVWRGGYQTVRPRGEY